jgi:hypothetical protein
LYYENLGWFNEYNGSTSHTWFLDNNMVLKTSFKIRELKENFELSISISEEEKDDYAMRPLCLDLKR